MAEVPNHPFNQEPDVTYHCKLFLMVWLVKRDHRDLVRPIEIIMPYPVDGHTTVPKEIGR